MKRSLRKELCGGTVTQRHGFRQRSKDSVVSWQRLRCGVASAACAAVRQRLRLVSAPRQHTMDGRQLPDPGTLQGLCTGTGPPGTLTV